MVDHYERQDDLPKQLEELKLQYESLKALYDHDIAERKKAEDALKESEIKYRSLVENSPDAITIYEEGIVVFVNNESLRLMAASSANELLGKPVIEFVHPDFRELVISRMQKVSTEGTILSLAEEKFVRLDGSEVEVEVKAIPIRFDNKPAVQLIVRDITERKNREEELRKLSQAVQQSPASVIITDMEGNIEYANPKTTEITGYSIEELIYENPRILGSGELPKEEYKKLWNNINSGKEWRGEFHNKKKNGELYWESASISPIIDEKGKVIHFLAVKEDITEKKETINELIKAKNEAESANKLKDAFIANISHEIRTPLNGILGMASLLQESYSQYTTEKEQQFSVAIERSSKRLINTVDKILNFSLLQVGDFPVNKAIVSLSTVLQTLIYEFKSLAAAKSLKLQFNSIIEDDNVFADEDTLHTALGNLIDNAIKFTESGYVDIVLYRDDYEILCIDIADTGTGISEKYLQNLFEPYSQEATGYNRPFEGIGLGLAITKKLLNLNMSTITVKSKKGEGSVFSIRFENQYGNQGEKTVSTGENKNIQNSNVVIGERPVILVVEDDVVNQLFAEAILHKEFNVAIADDATEALSVFNSRSFDLILMDISLKTGINGLDLTQEIRNGKGNKNIPIIAVTGHASPEDHRKALEAGCNDYIVKPFKSFQLLDKIHALISL